MHDLLGLRWDGRFGRCRWGRRRCASEKKRGEQGDERTLHRSRGSAETPLRRSRRTALSPWKYTWNASLLRGVDGGGEEQLAEAAPPVGLANGDGGDVGLVTQEPDADVAHEELARGRWWLFAEPAAKAVAQAAEEA